MKEGPRNLNQSHMERVMYQDLPFVGAGCLNPNRFNVFVGTPLVYLSFSAPIEKKIQVAWGEFV